METYYRNISAACQKENNQHAQHQNNSQRKKGKLHCIFWTVWTAVFEKEIDVDHFLKAINVWGRIHKTPEG